MREFEDCRQIDNIYEKAKKRIKEQIELKGVSCKGGAGAASWPRDCAMLMICCISCGLDRIAPSLSSISFNGLPPQFFQ